MKEPQPKLSRYGISHGIARRPPLEGGAVGEAQLTHSGLIYDTWGGYVSRLVEHWGVRGVDLTLDDACTALGIDKETVRTDASVQFRGTGYDDLSYDGYINQLKQSARREAAKEFYPLVDDLRQRVDDIVATLTTEDQDVVISSADTTNEEIEAITSSSQYGELMGRQALIGRTYESLFHNSIMTPTQKERDYFKNQKMKLKVQKDAVDEELDKFNTRIDILHMRRDAEVTGLAITLDKFIIALYEADVSDSPLSREWGAALAERVDEILHGLSGVDDESTKVSEIYVGRDAFEEFKDRISAHNQIRARVKQRMELIQPAFISDITIDNHPLLSGVGEK